MMRMTKDKKDNTGQEKDNKTPSIGEGWQIRESPHVSVAKGRPGILICIIFGKMLSACIIFRNFAQNKSEIENGL